MRPLANLTIALISLAACDTPSAPTIQAPQVNSVAPASAPLFNFSYLLVSNVFNPCPPEEEVEFSGWFHYLGIGEPETPTSMNYTIHINAQGFEGTGVVTGDRYRVMHNSREDVEFSFPPAQFEATFDSRFRLIRQGNDDDLWLRQTGRIAYPPEQIEIIRDEIECRG